MQTTTILNVPFHVTTIAEATTILHSFLKTDKNHMVITPNPEIVVNANKDPQLLNIIKSASLVVPDGIGIVIASKFSEQKISERVAGYDLITNFFATAAQKTTVYILGAKPTVAEVAAQNIQKKYPNIQVVGQHSGYFDKNQEELIKGEIREKKPQVLLVALGSPKQEKWMYENKDLPVNISIGIGGAVDVMAGTVKRAPRIFIKLNLEWFYRLLTNPKRIIRMGALPLFVVKVLFASKK